MASQRHEQGQSQGRQHQPDQVKQKLQKSHCQSIRMQAMGTARAIVP